MFVLASSVSVVDAAEDVARLADAVQHELDRIRESEQAADRSFPGATAAIILPNGHVEAFATGFADLEKGERMHPDMRMPSGSVGKMYVAAVTLSMVNDGLISLDDKVSHWIGGLEWYERVPNGDAITVRMLLNHSAGLIDHVFDEHYLAYIREYVASPNAVHREPTIEHQISFALGKPPLFQPGHGFNYTDTGYLLLGLVIEKASGDTYYGELQRRILDRLHLRRTAAQDRSDFAQLSQGYAERSSTLFGLPVRIVENGTLVFDPALEWTGGGLINNPQDMVRFAKAFFEGDAIAGEYTNALLGSSFIDGGKIEKTSAGFPLGYSLGVRIAHTDDGIVYAHSGFFPGYDSCLAYYPEHAIAVAVQINCDNASSREVLSKIAHLVIDFVNEARADAVGSRR